MPTFISGVASCSAIDSSGESVSIEGLDITSLARTGTITWEHCVGRDATGKSISINLPAQIVGKILKAKKIFTIADCETDNEHHFWNKTKLPFVYILAELLDDYTASAKEAAGQFKYSKDHPEQQSILGFSVEGSELPNSRAGIVIKKSIARKVTLTVAPCNKMCIAEIYNEPQKSEIKDDFESLFKSDAQAIEMFKSEEGPKAYEIFLAKKEETSLSKAEPSGIPRGWTPSISQHPKFGTVAAMAHPEHGTVTVHKNPENNQFEVKHAGKLAGVKGVKGSFGTNVEAISHAQKYVHGLHNGSILGRTTANMTSNPKEQLVKSLDAGSGNAAPSALSGGAVYAKESLGKPKKTDWNKRAKEEYDRWPQRENFEKFMKARMPHLHDGEIRAIGRTISLSKSLEFEKALNSLVKSESTLKKSEKSDKLDLVHYSSSPDRTEVDPKFQGSGVDQRTKGRSSEHKHSFYYRAGTQPEDVVTSRLPHKYHTQIDTHKQPLYDIAEDKEGHLAQSHDMDEAHGKIKAAGYHGFHNSKHDTLPHVVALYYPQKVHKSEDSLAKSEKDPGVHQNLGNHFLFSAENPKHPEKNELKMNHEQTLAHLKSKGFKAHAVKGHYGSPENSIMVHGVDHKQAEHLHGLASKLGQDSSIYSSGGKHEMRYHHGKHAGTPVHGEGTVWHKEKPKDFYTTMPSGKHFTHNIVPLDD